MDSPRGRSGSCLGRVEALGPRRGGRRCLGVCEDPCLSKKCLRVCRRFVQDASASGVRPPSGLNTRGTIYAFHLEEPGHWHFARSTGLLGEKKRWTFPGRRYSTLNNIPTPTNAGHEETKHGFKASSVATLMGTCRRRPW